MSEPTAAVLPRAAQHSPSRSRDPHNGDRPGHDKGIRDRCPPDRPRTRPLPGAQAPTAAQPTQPARTRGQAARRQGGEPAFAAARAPGGGSMTSSPRGPEGIAGADGPSARTCTTSGAPTAGNKPASAADDVLDQHRDARQRAVALLPPPAAGQPPTRLTGLTQRQRADQPDRAQRRRLAAQFRDPRPPRPRAWRPAQKITTERDNLQDFRSMPIADYSR